MEAKDAKIKLLNTIRLAINDGLTTARAEGVDDRWLEPVRRFRRDLEEEIAFLHGDEKNGPDSFEESH